MDALLFALVGLSCGFVGWAVSTWSASRHVWEVEMRDAQRIDALTGMISDMQSPEFDDGAGI